MPPSARTVNDPHDRALEPRLTRWFPTLAFFGVVACAAVAAGAGRLLGDELTFWRASQGGYFAAFSESRFYRILGAPVIYISFELSQGSPWALTLLSAIFVSVTIWLFVWVFARGVDPLHVTSMTPAAALFVVALPFSVYGILIRVVFSQLAAVCLMAAACAAAFAYMRAPPERARARTAMLALGSLTYGLSLLIYEVALMAPVVIAAIVYVMGESAGDRIAALKAWGLSLAVPLTIYAGLQIASIDGNPKLATGMQIDAASRAGLGVADQAAAKVSTLTRYLAWAWQAAVAGLLRGDRHAVVIAPGMLLAAAGTLTAMRHNLEPDGRGAKRLCIAGLTVFLSTMSLWGFYWIRDNVLITPPLYTTLLPNCGLALLALGLVRWPMSARLRAAVTGLAVVAVAAGVGTNLAILNANRIAKDQMAAQEAEVYLLRGKR